MMVSIGDVTDESLYTAHVYGPFQYSLFFFISMVIKHRIECRHDHTNLLQFPLSSAFFLSY